MIYLILAILSSVVIAVIMRIGETKVHNEMAMFFCNYAMCAALSLGYAGNHILPDSFEGVPFAIGLGLVTGIFYLLGFVFLRWNILHNGVMLSATFQKLGVIIPTVMAIVIFKESPGVLQVLGIGFAIAAILVINLEPAGKKNPVPEEKILSKEKEESAMDVIPGKMPMAEGDIKPSKLGLIGILLVCGLADSFSNIYEKMGVAALKDQYLLITFIMAMCLAFLLAKINGKGFVSVDIVFGIFIGIPNYYSIRFLLWALTEVPAIVTYPVFSAATILLVTAFSILLFREKLNKRKAIAILCVMAALIFLNI